MTRTADSIAALKKSIQMLKLHLLTPLYYLFHVHILHLQNTYFGVHI